MTEPWYTRLYKFLTGYSYAEDQERTIHPPIHIHPPEPVGEPVVTPIKPARRRIAPMPKGRKKR